MEERRKVQIALAEGDGSAPEQMAWATKIAIEAAKLDDIDIEFVPTPMGWCVFKEAGDTLPRESMDMATKLGLLFFGGVGEKSLDNTLGAGPNAKFKPEGRCLLTIRNEWGLLVNERPAIYYPELRGVAKVREDAIPDNGVRQIWLRFLLEDSYFGNRTFCGTIGWQAERLTGMRLKDAVTGDESIVADLAFYRASSVTEYFRYAFGRAKALGVPLICVDKSNVMARYVFWRKIAERIHERAFPDVQMRCHFSDDTTRLLFNPTMLDGVIACGNEHGDMLSDGALEAVGSMGMMFSSAINLKTRAAMFESGAGTYPEAKGKDIANPIGRILTGAMMLEHIGAVNGPAAIARAVRRAIAEGYKTPDLFRKGDDPNLRVGTCGMGEKILSLLTA
jgi:3-isopropylmalate dehydrogenase